MYVYTQKNKQLRNFLTSKKTLETFIYYDSNACT